MTDNEAINELKTLRSRSHGREDGVYYCVLSAAISILVGRSRDEISVDLDHAKKALGDWAA